MKIKTKIITITLVIIMMASAYTIADELGSPVDGGIRIASDYADSGSGTSGDPYINGIYNAFMTMTSNSKGEIYLGKAYYRESHGLVIDGNDNSKPRHLALRGSGFWDSVITLSPSLNEPFILCINRSSVYLTAIEIDGRKTQSSYTGPMIYLKSSYDVAMNDCFIENGKGDGIQIGAIDGSTGCWSTDISNCPIEYFDGSGVVISNCNNCIMESLTLGSNEGWEVDINGQSANTNVVLTNSYISASRHDAIRIGRYAQVQLIGNRFVDSGHAGINFDSSNTQRIVTITGNIFETTYGLYFTSSARAQTVITGNDFSLCTTPCNTPIKNIRGVITANPGLNPIGKWTTPFYNSFSYIEPNTGSASPTKSKTYTVQIAPAHIISTGGSSVSITVYDGKGNTMKNYGSTCDVILEVGQAISFGSYTTAPTVTVYFA